MMVVYDFGVSFAEYVLRGKANDYCQPNVPPLPSFVPVVAKKCTSVCVPATLPLLVWSQALYRAAGMVASFGRASTYTAGSLAQESCPQKLDVKPREFS